MDRTTLVLKPCHLGVPSSASKTISMPIVCSVQTVLVSCTDTNSICKQTKMGFHMTHVTYKFHRVHPKLFMSLWYVQGKQCTYLASRLAISLNRLNRAPPDPRHLGVPLGVSKTIYEPMVRSVQTVHLSSIKISTTRPSSPMITLATSKMIYEPMVRLTQTEHLSCTDTNTISK
jgi:hypothetical protein